MRQHSDKTGTKQIRCLKLTSKYQNDQNFFSSLVKTFPFLKRRLHNPLCGHSEESSRPRGSFKIFHCIKVRTKTFFCDNFHFHSSVLQTVWLVKKPATLQTIHKAASGVTPTIMTTSDSEIDFKSKKILITTYDKSGPTTGNGKTIQKQDLHPNMVSRPSQLSQYQSR